MTVRKNQEASDSRKKPKYHDTPELKKNQQNTPTKEMRCA